MSVFKSAMGYFSSGGANGGSDNDFVGQFVEIGNMKLRVKKVIAEGMQNIWFSFWLIHYLEYVKKLLEQCIYMLAMSRVTNWVSWRNERHTALGADKNFVFSPKHIHCTRHMQI